ncbi:zinc-ribbon domain-containing protein, partial [Achromobacter arsenitoxydans]
MSLSTRCPQCGTTFKVVPDQLRVRNGLVRCGACSTVFDGRACLLPAPGAPIAPAAPAGAPLPSSAATVAAPVLSAPTPHAP